MSCHGPPASVPRTRRRDSHARATLACFHPLPFDLLTPRMVRNQRASCFPHAMELWRLTSGALHLHPGAFLVRHDGADDHQFSIAVNVFILHDEWRRLL
eukprot:1550146-Prymnesium_polylepis.1